MMTTEVQLRPKILYIDAFSSPGAQANVWGMVKAYKAFANLKIFDYRHVAEQHGVGKMNTILVRTAQNFKPIFIHMGKGETIKGSSVQRIRSILPNCKIIHYYGDYRNSVERWVVDLGKYVDWTLLACESGPLVEAYRAAGCKTHWWAAGTDPSIFNPQKLEKIYDGVFMGNFLFYSGYWWILQRTELVTTLAEQGFRIHLFGACFAELAKTENIFAHPFAGEKAFAAVCSRAKICLAHSPNRDKLYTSWPRVVNTMASGAFLLTRHFPGIEELFDNHHHLVWFNTMDEAVELFEYYLVDDEKREKIAKAGRREVLTHHTWANRIQDLWSGVNGGWTK